MPSQDSGLKNPAAGNGILGPGDRGPEIVTRMAGEPPTFYSARYQLEIGAVLLSQLATLLRRDYRGPL